MNPLGQLVGESPGMVAVRETLGRLLQRQVDSGRLPPILIQGETGTGKGLAARAIHAAGPRAAGPFVDVNCAAIPETLLEAEMFGFERGAFTDARQAKRGLFQAAHRGTIFLDEVGLLPEALQSKLLKVIEEKMVRRLGSTRAEPVDVWIVTATSENLLAATRARGFREDLYHRLAVLTLWLPPLRERGADILQLAEHFLARACADYGLGAKTLAADARAALAAYPWPGNVRELTNVMERVALLWEDREVPAEALGIARARAERPARSGGEARLPLDDAVGEVERAHLLAALEETGWNISRAAARLGVPRNTLRYRMEKHAIRPEGPPPPRARGPAASLTSAAAPAPSAAPGAEAPPVAPAAPAAPPVVPPAVATAVRWEQRRLTVLRTVLAQPAGDPDGMDPSRALAIIVEKVHTFGGRVVELGATGVVAAFGLEPVEDGPRRAAHAARSIHAAAGRAWDGQAAGLAVRSAIYVGQFSVGRLGTTVEIDQDAKRPAWALLDGLVAAAEPGAIMVGEAAAPFLERRFELTPVAREAERAYRLGGAEPTGFGPRRVRFVGRQHELELLRGRLAAAARGQGQVVGIVGDPGIGKSRLLFEFRQAPAGQPVTCLEGQCLSYGTAIPYLPVIDIVRTLCGITDADSPEAAAEKVRAGLRQAAIDPAEAAPLVVQLLGQEGGSRRLAALSPEVVKARTFEVLRQIFLELSRRQPLIIVVEDLHWIDRTSEEFLTTLVDIVPGARILLLSTSRPGFHPPWIGKSYATQVALQPLAPEDSLRVLRSVLERGEPGDPLVEQQILTRADGNPFFLEELARAVREQGPLPAVPETIEEVLLVRIDRLGPDDRHLLQSAAVVGKDVPLSLLEAIAEAPGEALPAGLRRLTAAEFLYETSVGPEVGYTFKHALTHEVAYASLVPEVRRALHGRIVAAIEQLYADRRGEHVERLAHHAFRAEAWEKAMGYLRQAGAKVFARSANREAVACFEQALVALQHLPASRDRTEQSIDVRFDLRNPLQLLGEFERILEHLGEAERLAEALGEPGRLGWVHSFLAQGFRLKGDLDRAIASGERALAAATAVGDFRLQVATDIHLGPAYAALGDYRRAIEISRRSIRSLTGDWVHERFRLAGFPAVGSRINLVQCLAELGEFEEAVSLADEAIRLAESIEDPYSEVFAYFGAGMLWLLKGELPRSIAVLERGLALCEALNLPLMFPAVGASLGAAYALSGRPGAIPLLERAVEAATSMNLMTRYSTFLARLGEAYLLAGRPADARTLGERALRFARDHRERGHEAHALRLLADVAVGSEPGPPEGAEVLAHHALELAEALEMRPLQAQCRISLARLHARTGRRAEAEDALARAIKTFRELDMPFWLERAEADLRALP